MRIFVAGATGFVGGHLVRVLAQEGPRIQALVRPCADAGVDLRQRSLPSTPFRLTSAVLRRLLGPLGMDPALGKTVHFLTVPRAFDISKAKRELGFLRFTLEEGIRLMLTWHFAEGHLRPPMHVGAIAPSGADA